jgi:hypothetical protein
MICWYLKTYEQPCYIYFLWSQIPKWTMSLCVNVNVRKGWNSVSNNGWRKEKKCMKNDGLCAEMNIQTEKNLGCYVN